MDQSLITILTTLASGLLSGFFGYLIASKRTQASLQLKQKQTSNQHELDARAQLFEQYRKLVTTAQEMIDDLQKEIDKLHAEIKVVSTDYAKCMADCSALRVQVTQLQDQLDKTEKTCAHEQEELKKRIAELETELKQWRK